MISSWNKSLVTVCAVFWLAQRLPAQTVLINEVMSSNGGTLLDENGDSSDWIELYNAGSATVSLADWGLSDDPAQPFKWTFRDANIDAGGFLLVFASGKDRQPGLFTATNPASLPGL